MRSNCLVYALREYRMELRVWRQRGRPRGMTPLLQIGPSSLQPHWLPHFRVSAPIGRDNRAYAARGFVPLDTSPLRWWQLWRAVWFDGRVKIYHEDSND